MNGEQVFNGALDNASGVATVIELAKAHMALPHPTRRSVLFMTPTAEDAGLLGAKYYAEHPLYPLDTTMADIYIDGVTPWCKPRDIARIITQIRTEKIPAVAAAKTQGRVVNPDSQPEKEASIGLITLNFRNSEFPRFTLAKAKTSSVNRPASVSRRRMNTSPSIITNIPMR